MLSITLTRLEMPVHWVSILRDWKRLYTVYESREIENVCMLGINLVRLETSVCWVSISRDWKSLYAVYQPCEKNIFKSFLTYQSTQIGNVYMLGINLVRLEKSVPCVSALQKELLTSSSPSSCISVPRVLSFQPAVFSPFLGPMPILLNSMRGLLFPLISIMLQQKPKL